MAMVVPIVASALESCGRLGVDAKVEVEVLLPDRAVLAYSTFPFQRQSALGFPLTCSILYMCLMTQRFSAFIEIHKR